MEGLSREALQPNGQVASNVHVPSLMLKGLHSVIEHRNGRDLLLGGLS